MQLKVGEDHLHQVVEVVAGAVKAARLHGGDLATHMVELGAPNAKASAGALDEMTAESGRVRIEEDMDRPDDRKEGRKSGDIRIAAAQVLALRMGP